MSINDAVSRVQAIEAKIAALNGAVAPPASASANSIGGTATAVPTGAPGSTSFAGALNQAQASLPPGAAGKLTASQGEFAQRLASQTGLDPGVISAWLLAEESGGAATTREAAHNNDWLNIGYTDSGTFGSSDSVWSSPDAAADATAGWLKGQNTIPGYGTASAGIRAVLSTAGQSPQAQISALQRSGWASSGYPDLPGLYQQVAG